MQWVEMGREVFLLRRFSLLSQRLERVSWNVWLVWMC